MTERTRSQRGRMRLGVSGWLGVATLLFMLAACFVSTPYAFGRASNTDAPRYEAQSLDGFMLPPSWAPHSEDERARRDSLAADLQRTHLLGTDRLGRDFFARCLAGGAISLSIGLAAAAIAVIIGTIYGTLAGSIGGRVDAVMMRIVDIFYGLPYVLLVVLLAVAVDGVLSVAQSTADSGGGGILRTVAEHRRAVNVLTLLVAIGGVSWLTMARVIRGQVLSLRSQPFMEACRALGVPWRRQFTRHLLPNLVGPIVVYATLTVPLAILQESFLSFLGIGVQAPLPSWGNLASEGLAELNPIRSRWWLLFWPCVLLAITLLSLNFVGEGLREALDPRRRSSKPAAVRIPPGAAHDEGQRQRHSETSARHS